MKVFLVTLLLLSVLPLFKSPSFAGISSYNEIEILSSIGPMLMWQNADWISADTFITPSNSYHSNFNELEITTGFSEFIDYSESISPYMLIWKHDKYFSSIYPEETVTFSVLYRDVYDTQPSTGYPKLRFWPQNSQDYSIISMDYDGIENSCNAYIKQIKVSPGIYFYNYSVINDSLLDGYYLEISSFVVCQRPEGFVNIGITEGAVISNARNMLQWTVSDPDGGVLKYKLFIGDSPSNLAVIYEGIEPYFELTKLEYEKQYFWQIEAINIFGVSSRSPVYKFTTINQVVKAFNYPNPFNPALGDKTNIVFDMDKSGSAEISIFTEFGDNCWKKTFFNLLKGANEITYDGKDDNGRTLFNGPYVCSIQKIYSDQQSRETCRILVIK